MQLSDLDKRVKNRIAFSPDFRRILTGFAGCRQYKRDVFPRAPNTKCSSPGLLCGLQGRIAPAEPMRRMIHSGAQQELLASLPTLVQLSAVLFGNNSEILHHPEVGAHLAVRDRQMTTVRGWAPVALCSVTLP